MDLKKIYKKIDEKINTIDFEKIWAGFKPLKFAIYNDDACYFNGKYIEKTAEFVANTAIEYNKEYIAIVKIEEESLDDYDRLTSLIIHEMFHAFQNSFKISRGVNEHNALIKYQYNTDNLSSKLYEGKLLREMLIKNSFENFEALKKSMSYRQKSFPFEFYYEANTQEVEGTALFVELSVLEQLDKDKGRQAWEKLANRICDCKNYFPIRIISYDFGAAIIACYKKSGNREYEDFSNTNFFERLLDKVYGELKAEKSLEVEKEIEAFHFETKKIIDKALEKNDLIFEGEKPIYTANIWNARYLNGYVISNYFIALKNKEKIDSYYGDFVAKVDEDFNVYKIYRQ